MLIVRNLEYLSQVQSTLRYSRKLAALGRLSAGVAHEVKNPLNAMMIHLELLRQQFQPSDVHAPGRQRRRGGCGRRTGGAGGHRRRALSTSTSSPPRSGGSTKSSRGSSSSPGRRISSSSRSRSRICSTRSSRSCSPKRIGQACSVSVGVRRRAAGQRRSGDAAPGVPESRAERVSGDARAAARCAFSAKPRAGAACAIDVHGHGSRASSPST